jgi:hypothetical protein
MVHIGIGRLADQKKVNFDNKGRSTIPPNCACTKLALCTKNGIDFYLKVFRAKFSPGIIFIPNEVRTKMYFTITKKTLGFISCLYVCVYVREINI